MAKKVRHTSYVIFQHENTPSGNRAYRIERFDKMKDADARLSDLRKKHPNTVFEVVVEHHWEEPEEDVQPVAPESNT